MVQIKLRGRMDKMRQGEIIMRCPDCNKFVALELQDPEENSTEFDPQTGAIEAEYRIVRNCADCGTELKETTITLSGEVDVTEHQGEGHELTAEFEAEGVEEGGGRYAKSYFGVSCTCTVKCSCGELDETVDMSDKVAASEMEELV